MVILQQNVVEGLVLLNKIRFEDKGLQLIGADYEAEIPDMAKHGLHLLPPILTCAEVRGQALPQRAGLAHIDHFSRLVLHQVDPRLAGDGGQPRVHLCFGHSSTPHFPPHRDE